MITEKYSSYHFNDKNTNAVIHETQDLNNLLNDFFVSSPWEKLYSASPGIYCTLQLRADPSDVSCSVPEIEHCILQIIRDAFNSISSQGKIRISTHNQHIDDSYKSSSNVHPGEYVVFNVEVAGLGTNPENDYSGFLIKDDARTANNHNDSYELLWTTMIKHNGAVFVSNSSHGHCLQLFFPLFQQAETFRSRHSFSLINAIRDELHV